VVVTEKVLIFSMVSHEVSPSLPGEYRAASRGVQNSKCTDPLRGRNVGQTMLLSILIVVLILVLILSPVLIPALVTAFHLVARLRNSNGFVTVTR
jgi:hypothetical protein